MASKIKPVPDGYPTATPYLTVKNGASALDFYVRAFGATETMRFVAPDGKIGHAEIQIGTSPIMLSDEYPQMGVLSPESIGGTPVMLHLYVEDVDAVVRQALAAGAKIVTEVADQFYGDRAGKISDPFGHVWWIASHTEDVSRDEVARRARAMYEKQPGT